MIKHTLSCLALLIGFSASATNHVVTSTNDAGAGTLREEITNAIAGDTITFDGSLIGSTITLSSEIAFAKSLAIIGPGSENLSIDANFNSRIFKITDGDIYISGLKLLNGFLTGSLEYHGGVINHSDAGTLRLNDIHFEFSDCRQSNGSQGGGLFYAVNDGRLEMDSCKFTNNNADNYGGAVSCNGSADYCRINYCWFDGNTASTGPAGAIFSNADTLEIFNSTLSNNSGLQTASLWSRSSYKFALLKIVNSTFSKNIASVPSNIFDVSKGSVELINNTFHMDNEPIRIQGNIHSFDTVNLVVQNNIFNNTGLNIEYNENVICTSLGGNVCSDTSMRRFLNNTNDTNEVSAGIEANSSTNGGFMPSHAILRGSVAIKNGTPGGPLTDQLGRIRTYLDAGAVDYICPVVQGTDTRTVCDSFIWIDGNTYNANTTTATYLLVDAAASGCDSLVTLNLTVNSTPDKGVLRNGKTLSSDAPFANHVWLDCDKNMEPIQGETGPSFTVKTSGNYALEVSNGACIDTSDCINVDLTGILESNFSDAIQVYPNPTSKDIQIRFSALQSHLNIEVRNALGQVVLVKEFTQTDLVELELNQANGIYFIEINDDKHQKALVRIVKR
ncbi:MAG: T9SS type A sorting domain-containing protein [Bacteroidetes bacterium]|nr:MAG: T9SS type A sorting domain-containing protein [Bacteroidota bacterium]